MNEFLSLKQEQEKLFVLMQCFSGKVHPIGWTGTMSTIRIDDKNKNKNNYKRI